MLTDKQIEEIRSRFSIFQSKIHLNSYFVHVYNTMDDVKAVAEVLRKNINLMVLDSASVGSYD